MRSKQRGVTLIGWILLLTPLAICAYAGIRLAPVYLNYMKVARTLEQVKADYKGGAPADQFAIRTALEKRLFIESVEFPDAKDMKITRERQSHGSSKLPMTTRRRCSQTSLYSCPSTSRSPSGAKAASKCFRIGHERRGLARPLDTRAARLPTA